MNQHRKNLVKLLQANGYRHHTHRVFADFVHMAACAISCAVDPHDRVEREAQYAQAIATYDPDERAQFGQMLGELTLAMEEEPGDVLGSVFGELGFGNDAAGQFFTPNEVCRLMAALTINPDEARELIAEQGYITVHEPAVGAGAMLIAFALYLKEHDINYQKHMYVTCVDIDSRAACMAYVQLSLMHIPAVVIVGNSLTMVEREHWRTPAHILGNWEMRLRARRESAGVDAGEKPLDVAETADVDRGELAHIATQQLPLFVHFEQDQRASASAAA